VFQQHVCLAPPPPGPHQFERAAREVLRDDHHQTAEGEDYAPPQVQVLLYSSRAMGPASIRQLSVSGPHVLGVGRVWEVCAAMGVPVVHALMLQLACTSCAAAPPPPLSWACPCPLWVVGLFAVAVGRRVLTTTSDATPTSPSHAPAP
jgi:hypothetical protein